jgi:hypothetical protein
MRQGATLVYVNNQLLEVIMGSQSVNSGQQ